MIKSHPRMRWPLADGSIPTRIKQFIEINVTGPQVPLTSAAALEMSCKPCILFSVTLASNSQIQPLSLTSIKGKGGGLPLNSIIRSYPEIFSRLFRSTKSRQVMKKIRGTLVEIE